MLTIVLLVESGRAFGRGLLRGIARYARAQGNWSIIYHPWEWDDKTPRWLTQAHCDGAIARIDSIPLLRALQRLKVPVVDVRRKFPTPGIAMVGSEYGLIAQLAVDHLREKGFRHFAYCGYAGVDYSARRRDDFVNCLNDHQKAPIYEGRTPHTAETWQRESEAMFHERELGAWLAKLPKPIGLMACNDMRGRQVLNACKTRHITVPDEVAVIGVDNDEVLCELADPPLSSVIPATDRIGYEAARLLDGMMCGGQAPLREVCIQPLGVAARRSTDVLAVEDRRVAMALRFIRDHTNEGLTVEDVLDHLCCATTQMQVSRSTLEHLFAEIRGHSPKEEIMRVRLERVKQLLVDTDCSLPEVAARAGIKHAEYLSALFKRKLGLTPGEFRRRMQRRQGFS